MLHPFPPDTPLSPLPRLFTYPFCYEPHPLCRRAAEAVKGHLATRDEWQAELRKGKMFGVLVAEAPDGRVGYLAAFSGILAGKANHPYFVPPVYDLQDPAGFFPREEAAIGQLNARIREAEADPRYLALRDEHGRLQAEAEQRISAARQALKTAKARRDSERAAGASQETLTRLIRESLHEKAEFHRLKKQWEARLEASRDACAPYEETLTRLKHERHARSAAAQERIFRHFRMRNARGEEKDLCEIFAATPQGFPPAGSGECAAPKLLQYAFLHHLRPVAMAEFWWGNSPKDTLRRHGHYYPACTEKCGPILHFMLEGMEVEPDPLAEDRYRGAELEVLYEDPWLVAVRKPEGMLSVPGKKGTFSVLDWLRTRYPEATGPLLVHRLDMDTSGILLAAKSKAAHQNLQAQFKNHSIRKTYVAILEGEVKADEGSIDLPLRLDPPNRPRRTIDRLHGKPALTRFRVVARKGRHTRVLFFPLTGRTHQLRVHAAHPEGLDAPILGDRLYGTTAGRLYLHAASLEFVHPATNLPVRIDCPSGF